MGLFSRKRKQKFDMKPVPGRDDLVAVESGQVGEWAQQAALEIVMSTDHETFPKWGKILSLGASRILGRQDPERHGDPVSRAAVINAVRYGFALRRQEIDKMNGDLRRASVSGLYDAYASVTRGSDEPGYVNSMNAALGFSAMPFNSEPEKSQDLVTIFPGYPAVVRELVSHLLHQGLAAQLSEQGDSGSVPSTDVWNTVFGYAYMIHIWSEIAPDGWLDGVEELA